MSEGNVPAIPDNFPVIQDNCPVLTGRFVFFYDGFQYTVENNKLYNKDHEVAVVYSPDYGGGWASWHEDVDPTDARVAILTLTGMAAKLTHTWYGSEHEVRFDNRRFYPYENTMSDELDIEWVPAGTLYKIDEYDGSERVVTSGSVEWRIA